MCQVLASLPRVRRRAGFEPLAAVVPGMGMSPCPAYAVEQALNRPTRLVALSRTASTATWGTGTPRSPPDLGHPCSTFALSLRLCPDHSPRLSLFALSLPRSDPRTLRFHSHPPPWSQRGAPVPHSRLETWPTLAPLFAPDLGHRRPALHHRALLSNFEHTRARSPTMLQFGTALITPTTSGANSCIMGAGTRITALIRP